MRNLKVFVFLLALLSINISCSDKYEPQGMVEATIQPYYDNFEVDKIDIYVEDNVKDSPEIQKIRNVYESVTGGTTVNRIDPETALVVIDSNKIDTILGLLSRQEYTKINSLVQKDVFQP